MPELPEVETVVRTLEKQVGNALIKGVNILYPRIIENVSNEQFSNLLINQRIEEYGRRGKFLVFTLTDYILVAHLRMEGKFYFFPNGEQPRKHTHLVFYLDNGQLHYNDVRKFGRFYLYSKNEMIKAISTLGYEPFDEKLTAEYCKEYCKKNRKPIKQTLLDQGMIAGIGNIYANEICFKAAINPHYPSNKVSLTKWNEIIEATKLILSEAIRAGGTTIRSYTSSLGVTGLFQQSLYVHGREKQECFKCGSIIVKEKIDGRGTYYCPCCQKNSPITIAITGSMGSGKSMVTNYIKQKGYSTISCDDVNKDLLQKEETKRALANIFNTTKDLINKEYIKEKIFNDDSKKQEVENYLHHKIKEEIDSWIKDHFEEEYLFVEVPLLFETDWHRYFGLNIDVYCDEKIMYERLMNDRKMKKEDIDERLKKQLPIEEKKRLSDYLIENNGTPEQLYLKIDKFIDNI